TLQLVGAGLGSAAVVAGAAVSSSDSGSGSSATPDTTAPEITSGTTAAAIDENSGANQVVYTVTATDDNPVTYSLSGDDASLFTIDSATGDVTLIADPDYETQSSYSFNVVATDEAGNTSEQAVSLDINDLDDTAPEITSGTTAAAIDENSGANQVVYTVTATDDNAITYSLSGDDASLFTIGAITGIGAATGEVTLIADPDYETQSSYSFNVVATDEAGNESEQAVSLDINDLDDTAPEITSGTTAAAIDENSGANQVVYTVVATDDNAITYSLSGDDASLFTIDSATGDVTLIADPDYETQSSYSFNVVATDEAGNESEQAVSLDINDLDEVEPTNTFTSAAYDEASNTLTLTGADMNTLLFDGEDATTDIKDNLNWDNLTWDINTDNNDSNNVNFSLSDIDSVYVQDDNTLTITLTNTAASSLEGSTDFDPLTSNDSITISEGFSSDTAGNISTTDGMERDTSIVVFDLVNGTSSSHSDRSFDANVSYTIYIVVDSDTNSLNNNFATWSEANNLGSDDLILLVGNDASNPIVNVGGITNVRTSSGGILLWETSLGSAARFTAGGNIRREVNNSEGGAVDLWDGGWSYPNVPAQTSVNQTRPFLNTLPAGILTSQGLV
ncbi:cadherin repeat domain-containing protein, partial [Psychromonas algicola]|uniref:cadherin repeat domain-containing protein n=1 Tax=Psychromonas algicola TaxID=2555642 RepID=UPI001067C679